VPRFWLPLVAVAAACTNASEGTGISPLAGGTGGSSDASAAGSSGAGSGGEAASAGTGGSAGVGGAGAGGAGAAGTGGALGAAGSTGSGGSTVTDGGMCVTGKKRCGGLCVEVTPAYGCDPTGCTGCSPVSNAVMKCTGTQCDFDCNQGYVKSGMRCNLPDAASSGGSSGMGGSSGSSGAGGSAGIDAGACSTAKNCNECIPCCQALGKGFACSPTSCRCNN
jgi:hypothetical protein